MSHPAVRLFRDRIGVHIIASCRRSRRCHSPRGGAERRQEGLFSAAVEANCCYLLRRRGEHTCSPTRDGFIVLETEGGGLRPASSLSDFNYCVNGRNVFLYLPSLLLHKSIACDGGWPGTFASGPRRITGARAHTEVSGGFSLRGGIPRISRSRARVLTYSYTTTPQLIS
jgi:hypothetical protein